MVRGSDDDRHAAAMGEDEEQTVKFGLGEEVADHSGDCCHVVTVLFMCGVERGEDVGLRVLIPVIG